LMLEPICAPFSLSAPWPGGAQRGQVGSLHRQGRDAHETCWIAGDGFGDLVILQG
jgi:hypothetical protein